MAPSRDLTELNVRILEIKGKLNYDTIKSLNCDLKSKGCDFQVRYIEHGYPYYSTYFEIQDIADCNSSKYKRKFESHGTNTTYRVHQGIEENSHKRIIIIEAVKSTKKYLKNKITAFFKGCKYKQCFSEHCKNFAIKNNYLDKLRKNKKDGL